MFLSKYAFNNPLNLKPESVLILILRSWSSHTSEFAIGKRELESTI